jgi:hypothetical protein
VAGRVAEASTLWRVMSQQKGASQGQPRVERSLEDLRAYLATWRINKCLALYLVTRNGTHAWTAYRLAREAHLSIPDWVLTYFDEAVVALGAATTVKAVADAFGLGSKGGPFATNKARNDWRNLDVIQFVDHFKATDPQTLDPALRRALELNGPFWLVGQRMTPKLSAERVQEIYYQAFKDFPPK